MTFRKKTSHIARNANIILTRQTNIHTNIIDTDVIDAENAKPRAFAVQKALPHLHARPTH